MQTYNFSVYQDLTKPCPERGVPACGKENYFWINKRFNNLLDFIGIDEGNIQKLELNPITPKLVSICILFVMKQHEIPTTKYQTLHFILNKNAEIVPKEIP